MNRCLFPDGAFKLEQNQRQAVDVENCVGDALLKARDFKLIDDFVDIFVFKRIIDQMDEYILFAAILSLEEKSVRDERHERLIATVNIGSGQHFEPTDYQVNFAWSDALVGIAFA